MSEYEIKRSTNEIDRLYLAADEGVGEGTRFPDMNYEEGIIAALCWLFGERADHPCPQR